MTAPTAYRHDAASPSRDRSHPPATPSSKRALRLRTTAAARTSWLALAWSEARSFCPLPLAGNRDHHAQPAIAAGRSAGGRLHHQLVHEQERHAGLDVVEQLLQRGLADLAVRDHRDEAGLGLR